MHCRWPERSDAAGCRASCAQTLMTVAQFPRHRSHELTRARLSAEVLALVPPEKVCTAAARVHTSEIKRCMVIVDAVPRATELLCPFCSFPPRGCFGVLGSTCDSCLLGTTAKLSASDLTACTRCALISASSVLDFSATTAFGTCEANARAACVSPQECTCTR